MNLILSVDEQILKRARKTARAMGKSVNQLVREYLEQLANTKEDTTAPEAYDATSKSFAG